MECLSRINTGEAIVAHFRQKILNGELQPGDRLESERKLQDRFHISRFALREGLARLNALGLIKVQHGKGSFVSGEVSKESLANVLTPLAPSCDQSTHELLEARTFLEGELSALACARRTGTGLTCLDDNIDQAEACIDDLEDFCLADLAFHRLIACMAKNSFLFNMHAAMWEHILPVMQRNAAKRTSREAILDRHRQLARALQSENVERVRQLSAHFLQLGIHNYC